LTIEEDGIYFDKSPFVAISNVARQINLATSFKSNTITYFKNTKYAINMLTPEGRNDTVYSEMANKFQTFFRIYGTVTDQFQRQVEQSIEDSAESLKAWFKEKDPYTWTELVE
jgi:hypothetical protein